MTKEDLLFLYRGALRDAMVMFEQIEHNRNMPPEANTLRQYISMGHYIRKLLDEPETST